MSSKILKEPAGDKFEIALKCLNKHINTIWHISLLSKDYTENCLLIETTIKK